MKREPVRGNPASTTTDGGKNTPLKDREQTFGFERCETSGGGSNIVQPETGDVDKDKPPMLLLRRSNTGRNGRFVSSLGYSVLHGNEGN